MVPLGYTIRDRKPVVVEEEAERVRLIFKGYMELGGIGPLLADPTITDVLVNGTDVWVVNTLFDRAACSAGA